MGIKHCQQAVWRLAGVTSGVKRYLTFRKGLRGLDFDYRASLKQQKNRTLPDQAWSNFRVSGKSQTGGQDVAHDFRTWSVPFRLASSTI